MSLIVNKYIMSIGIIGFWIFLPIPFMLMNIGGYTIIDVTQFNWVQSLISIPILGTIIGLGANLFNVLLLYIQLAFIKFPYIFNDGRLNAIFSIGRAFMQFLTVILLFLMWRQD